jgi:DNA-binding NarL/FixJ family response regulator
MISGRDDPATLHRVRRSGASGFIAKAADVDQALAALDAVLAGELAFDGPGDEGAPPALTERQAEVLTLLCEGHGNKEIRYRLGIAERTVRAHMTELFQLLGANSRVQAILRARRLGLAD